MRVTCLEWPLPDCDMFSGDATGDDGKLYYHRPRKRFAVMKQDVKVLKAWFYCDPPGRYEARRSIGD